MALKMNIIFPVILLISCISSQPILAMKRSLSDANLEPSDRPQKRQGLDEQVQDTKLLEHPCFEGESLTFQNNFFASDYANIPEIQLQIFRMILNSAQLLNEENELSACFLYHAHYRKKCLGLIEEQDKYCADVDRSKITQYRGRIPVQGNNDEGENNEYCTEVRKLLINLINRTSAPDLGGPTYELLMNTIISQNKCSKFNHKLHAEMLNAAELNDYIEIISLHNISRQMKCNSALFEMLWSDKVEELGLV